jgi:glycosyltransferase involved in cell wall biosynthesis
MRVTSESKVSIVMPTVGASPHMLDAIRGIIDQTHCNFELIVVNDAKNLENEDRVNSLSKIVNDRRMVVVRSNRSGLPAARNTGIQEATGDLIFLCDDDDIWHCDKVKRQIEIMNEENLDIHLSNFVKISESGNKLDVCDYKNSAKFPQSLALNFIAPPSGWAIKRCVLDSVGLFDERYFSTEDKEFLLRVSKHFEVARLGEPLWQYRISDGAISRNPMRKLRFNVKLLNKYKSDVITYGDLSFGFVKFVLKVSVACDRARASEAILRLYRNSSASMRNKLRLELTYRLFRLFRRRVLKDVS